MLRFLTYLVSIPGRMVHIQVKFDFTCASRDANFCHEIRRLDPGSKYRGFSYHNKSNLPDGKNRF
jgi:hypothetical protein